jgi:N,N'-diacetyllegionaminate synthase
VRSNQPVSLGSKVVGGDAPCFLAAEAGTTCNGNLSMAKELIDVAADAGFDAIKFQTIGPDANLSDKTVMYRYKTMDGWAEQNMYEMFQTLVFQPEEWQELARYTRSKGLIFFSSADYLEGVDILEACNVPIHKSGSWDVTYEPLIIKMAKTGKPLMLDLGPSTLAEIVRFMELSRQYGKGAAILLHDFHTDVAAQMNMRNIPYLQKMFGLPVGFSAPGRQDDLDIIAVALGADLIEKRITLSRKTPGHHHAVSIEPSELKPWVERIRVAEASLGSREVRPSEADLADAKKYFRSICTLRSIRRGEPYTPENLDGKRPGNGIPTRHLDQFWGRSAPLDLEADKLLTWKDL